MAELPHVQDTLANVGLQALRINNNDQVGLYSARSPYLGPGATRTYFPNVNNGSSKFFNARTYHIARTPIKRLKIEIPNWWVNVGASGVEQNAGGIVTFTASVEYPVGVFTPITFNAGATSVAAADGSTTRSDSANVVIPEGAGFLIRIYGVIGTGATLVFSSIPTGNLGLVSLGEAFEVGVSATAIPDKTMGGTIGSNANPAQQNFFPCSILTSTNRRTFFLPDNSRGMGIWGDATQSFDTGETAPSIGSTHAYINAGIPSDRMMWACANYTKRLAVSLSCSDIVVGDTVNDYRNGQTAAQVLANLATFYALFGSKPIYQMTSAPTDTTTTDSWATVANQTFTNNSAQTQLLAGNQLILQQPALLSGVCDLASAVTDPATGKWRATGAPFGVTNDGVHESPGGYALIVASGLVRETLGI